MPIALDGADLKILAALQEDASLSTVDLAERAGVSQSVCWRRIQRLKDEGVIQRQVTLLDRAKLGLETQIFAEVKLSAHGRANLSEFSEAIRAFPEVMECYLLLGAVDFLLKIVTQNIRAYEVFFFEKLSRLPGVQEVNSIVVFSEIKATTKLPLGDFPPSPAL
jgi:Lrp/AsnC family transcriptional regulator